MGEYGRRLGEYLLAGEYAQAKALLETLAEEADGHAVSPETLHGILNEVVLVLTNVALRWSISTAQLQYLYDEHFAEGGICTQRQQKFLRQVLPEFLEELCCSLQTCDDLTDRIEQYIATYAMEYTFSVKNMANHFAVSPIDLRRAFYNKTGRHLREYIWERRLERAKELLATTDCSIREVVQGVGYIDVSNFTRKFRMCTGMTPGEYRLAKQRESKLA